MRHSGQVRVLVHVSTRASRPGVGGRYGDAEPAVLSVRVSAPAVDGRANEAVVRALADALGVSRSAVRILRGATARTKLVEVEGGDEQELGRLLALRP